MTVWSLTLRVFAAALLGVCLHAAEQRGQVRFHDQPVPGAEVIAEQGGQRVQAITDGNGAYTLVGLAAGRWTVTVKMTGFGPQTKEVDASADASASRETWSLQMLTLEQLRIQAPPSGRLVSQSGSNQSPESGSATSSAAVTAQSQELAQESAQESAKGVEQAARGAQRPAAETNTAQAQTTQVDPAEPDEMQRRAADGFLINGTANNGAASPFAQSAAFGNARHNGRPQYNGNLGVIAENSALNARPYSLTGQDTARPTYSRLQGLASFGGPLRIPKLLPSGGPNVTLNYQWVHNRDISALTGLMPTAAERAGDLSAQSRPVLDPSTGQPFPGNVIPASRISPQARALLGLYPLPNQGGGGAGHYNYQVAGTGATHQDNLQARFNQKLTRRDQVFGAVAWQSTRTDSPSIFGFVDRNRTSGVNSGVNWMHTFHPRLYTIVGVSFSRAAVETTPHFAGRANVSGAAGIGGNNQDPVNWGPPGLNFSGGIQSLLDAQYVSTRNQTTGVSVEVGAIHGKHHLKMGGGFSRQQFNSLGQEDPRGTFGFTGASTGGSDFAGFLLGIPDVSSIAFGNADKYFRSNLANLFFNDDWRISSGFTLNLGLRWEYSSPITELYGRLVNLDIAPGFSAVTPVVAVTPEGALTGARYPGSLLRPDRNNLAPRIAFAWRPFAASSLVVRGGYGVYYDTSIYQTIAARMAQQSPLSTSLRVQNSGENPLTLADGFTAPAGITPNTFAVDPNLRVGASQNWNLSVQRDLPYSLVMIASYQGSKGTRGQQQFLPNTVAPGAINLCSACPTGFVYLMSNGNANRHAAQIELRRRLRSGFTASVNYTFAKAIDNSALGGRNEGGALVAQNWLDLRAERARSNFDQRHLLVAELQYTTGMGLRGGTLMNGWTGRMLKDWTFSTLLTAGSGLPLTPQYPAVVQGTGVTGTLRPDYTGAPLYDAPAGLGLNPAAFTAPATGRWGNAGRNSITGPSQLALDASMSRTFRLNDRWSLDARVETTNVLNHPVFPSWNTMATSAQFGLPNPANPMRNVQTVLRARF